LENGNLEEIDRTVVKDDKDNSIDTEIVVDEKNIEKKTNSNKPKAIEFLKEQNRAKELDIKIKELKNEERKLNIEELQIKLEAKKMGIDI